VFADRDRLMQVNREADAYTASRTFRERPMALGFMNTEVSEPIHFKGWAYTKEKSPISGGDWLRSDETKPVDMTIPFFGEMKPSASVMLPEAYVIPAQWTDVIERLNWHGISYHRMSSPTSVKVSTYQFDNAKWIDSPTAGRQIVASLDMTEITSEILFPAGSVVVPTGQRTARVIAHLLEPASKWNSLLGVGFFNTIFEQKEWAEDYIMEGVARDMLAKDPALKVELDRKKASDKAFATDPEAVLNWLYNRSPYRDPQMNIYPVGRVMDAETAKGLMTK
jgi:hypothetical protein